MKILNINNKMVLGLVSTIIITLSANLYSQVTKVWETESIFSTPESIVYDSINNCLYVSNFNDKGGFRKKDDKFYDEYISKIDLKGNILEFRWVDKLLAPTGLAIYNNKLYFVNREGFGIINIETRKIEKRISIEGAGFLNDIAIDKNGIIYITDTRKNCIYKIHNGMSQVWFTNDLMNQSNGLFIDNNNLIVGNKGNANLISISLIDKSTEILARDITMNIDGIKKLDENYILSWRSELYILDSDYQKTLLFKADNDDFLADFEFIKESRLLVIPTLLTNKVIALKINTQE